jgi:hypothetical protein
LAVRAFQRRGDLSYLEFGKINLTYLDVCFHVHLSIMQKKPAQTIGAICKKHEKDEDATGDDEGLVSF